MKYTESNKPLVCMQTQSTCYKGTTKMTPKGVLWHSTGANNPALKRYVQPSDVRPAEDTYSKEEWLNILGKNQYNNDWNHISRQAGLNAWIGKLADGSVSAVQTMPWDFKPWGCGSGPNGSCNTGWMQFEICEDGLTNKEYFDAVYKEACELTAYYCKMYGLDPKGTVQHNGVTVPVILDHSTSYKLGLGGNHGDVMHWFKKHGKTLEDVRDDVAALIDASKPAPAPAPAPEQPKEVYRIRKSWDNVSSQVGAYSVLDNAKRACDAAGPEYKVFNSKGESIYPEPIKTPVVEVVDTKKEITAGDVVSISKDAVYYNGKAVPSWVKAKTWIVKKITGDRAVVDKSEDGANAINSAINVSFLSLKEPQKTQSTNAATTVQTAHTMLKEGSKGPEVEQLQRKLTSLGYSLGAVDGDFGPKTKGAVIAFQKDNDLDPDGICGPLTWAKLDNAKYLNGEVTANSLNIRTGPGTNYKVKSIVKKSDKVVVVSETSGWGRLINGAGWVDMSYVKKS